MTDDGTTELFFDRGGVEMSIIVCAICGSDDPNHDIRHGDMTHVSRIIDSLVKTFNLERCDDCRKAYAGPAYYTFPSDGCDPGREHECTENVCPSCAGPYLSPDNENDPRRPMLTTDEILELLERSHDASRISFT